MDPVVAGRLALMLTGVLDMLISTMPEDPSTLSDREIQERMSNGLSRFVNNIVEPLYPVEKEGRKKFCRDIDHLIAVGIGNRRG